MEVEHDAQHRQIEKKKKTRKLVEAQTKSHGCETRKHTVHKIPVSLLHYCPVIGVTAPVHRGSPVYSAFLFLLSRG